MSEEFDMKKAEELIKELKKHIRVAEIKEKKYTETRHTVNLFAIRKLYKVKMVVNGKVIKISTPHYLGFGKATFLQIDGKEICGWYRNDFAAMINNMICNEVWRRQQKNYKEQEEKLDEDIKESIEVLGG